MSRWSSSAANLGRSAWVDSGAASLAGWPGGPGLVPPTPLLDRIARLGDAAGTDPWRVLTARAAVAGFTRNGRTSCGGGTRFVRAADGWIAASLVRPDDLDAVAAWLELDRDPGPDPWPTIVAEAAARPAVPLVAQGVLLGLPVALIGERVRGTGSASTGDPADDDLLPGRCLDLGPAARTPRLEPLVVDLSSLWAGPVCARVLGDAGARVVKVESAERPDGARRGPAAFYDHLHAGHEAVAVAFSTDDGRRDLAALLRAADVVIEASRPRALAQLGLGPDDLGPDGPAVWVSITGHGRTGPNADRVGFGDDAAVAGGLVGWTEDGPVFGGDAIADPLTGLAAAAAVRHALSDAARAVGTPGRCLVDVSLAGVAAWVSAGVPAEPDGGAPTRWGEVADPPRPPPLVSPSGPAAAHGADTAEVLASFR